MLLTEELADEGYPIQGVEATTSKWERLLEASPKIEDGTVIFREEGDEELIRQLTEFPDVDHDDIMDALVWGILEHANVSNYSIYAI